MAEVTLFEEPSSQVLAERLQVGQYCGYSLGAAPPWLLSLHGCLWRWETTRAAPGRDPFSVDVGRGGKGGSETGWEDRTLAGLEFGRIQGCCRGLSF